MRKLLTLFGLLYSFISFADVSLSSESKICQISPIFAGEKLDESKHVCKVTFIVKGPLGKFGSMQVVGELIQDELKLGKRSGFLIITRFMEDNEDWIKIPEDCPLPDGKKVNCLDGGLGPRTVFNANLPMSSVFPSALSWLTISYPVYPQNTSFIFPDCRDPVMSQFCSSSKKLSAQDEIRKFEAQLVFYANEDENSHASISIQTRIHIKKSYEEESKKQLFIDLYTDSRFDKKWNKEKLSKLIDLLSTEVTKIYSQVAGLELKVETRIVGSKTVLPIPRGQADLLETDQLAESLDVELPLNTKNCSSEVQKDLLRNPRMIVLLTESFRDQSKLGVSIMNELTSCYTKVPHLILSKEVLEQLDFKRSANLFAHEVLHSLGIQHIVESNGLPDTIRDTPSCSYGKSKGYKVMPEACTYDTMIEAPFINSCSSVCPEKEIGPCLVKKECVYGYLMYPIIMRGSPAMVTPGTMLRALQHPLIR